MTVIAHRKIMFAIAELDASDRVRGDVVLSVVASDGAAFRELYVRNAAYVRRLARRLGTPHAELDDVVQEVFEKAFKELPKLRGEFSHWLHRICANTVTDHHRKRRVRRGFLKLWGSPAWAEVAASPDDTDDEARAEQLLSDVLARLRPKHREALVLFELEGLSGEEIAARVGCSINTVWTRLHHARKAAARLSRRLGVQAEIRSHLETPS